MWACRDFFRRAGSFERGQGVTDRMRRSTDLLEPTSVDREVSSFHEDHPAAHFIPISIVPHHTRQELFLTPVPIPQEQIRSIGKPPVPFGDADGSQCGVGVLVWTLHPTPDLPSARPSKGGRRGFTRRELQTRTFQGRPSKTPPEFHEKTPRKRQKERKKEAGEGQKNAKFLDPTLRVPIFSRFGPRPLGP